MDFIRRALLFTKAKLSRTILLIVAFSAILVFVLSGLVINTAANRSIENAKKSVGATVTLTINRQAIMKEAPHSTQDSGTTDSSSKKPIKMPSITKTDADKIAKLSGVKSYSYTKQATANAASGITAVTTTSASTEDSDKQTNDVPGGPALPDDVNGTSGDFQIVGTNDLASTSEFTQGTNTITSGRAIKTSDEATNNAVIEESLAKENNLKVNSTFTLKDSNNKSYKMNVVGIYKSGSASSDLASNFSFMDPANQIYTALSMPNAIQGSSSTISNALFNLKNPEEASKFVKEAEKLIDTDKLALQSNDAIYQQMLQPLNNISSFSKNIVILVALAGAIILALITMLMVRERRFEIGVLMSLGESKGKIIAQFFTELFIVMLLSVGLASATGNFVGKAVGQQLLKQEIQTTQSDMQGQKASSEGQAARPEGGRAPENGGIRSLIGIGQSTEQQEALNKLEVKITAKQVAILVTIALLITLLAIGLAAVGILRLNPKQVLTN